MADDIDLNNTHAESPLKIPVRRVVWCTVIFAAWSAVVSALHAWKPDNFDTTSVVVAEIGMLPILLLMVRQLNLKWGDKSLGVIPAEVETALKVERAFKETETIVGAPSGERIYATTASAERMAAEVTNAKAEAGSEEDEPASAEAPVSPDLPSVAYVEDSTVLVRLRAELERRLRTLAKTFDIPVNSQTHPQLLLAGLTGRGVISSNEARGIIELIRLGNQQLHGLPMSPAAADYARAEGERLLSALSSLPRRMDMELVRTITERARGAGLEALQTHDADVIVKPDLAVEVKVSGSQRHVEHALSQVERVMKAQKLPKGLVVFGTPPSAYSMPSEDLKSVGIAWRQPRGEFAGNDVAKAVAPWLFGAAGTTATI